MIKYVRGYMDKYLINVNQLNEKMTTISKEYIFECENKYKEQLKMAVDKIVTKKNVKFILLAGPSSSGKTTTAKLLKQNLIDAGYNCKTISLDDFFVERKNTPLWENGRPNYESVDAIDWGLFDKCMHELLKNGKTIMPAYDFISGTKSFKYTLTLGKNDIIIIEGLHSLNPIIDRFISTKLSVKIFLRPAVEYYYNDQIILSGRQLRFFRRLIRDAYTRGASPERTLDEWNEVLLGEQLYIDPYKHSAEFVINTSHPYEVCIYHSIIKYLNLSANPKFTLLIEPFEKFLLTDKSLVPDDSLLQEFVH